MSEKNINPVVNKIDFDENTAEPIIVEVPEKEIIKQEAQQEKQAKALEKENIKAENSKKSQGEQLYMANVGISKEEEKKINKRQKFFALACKLFFVVFIIAALGITFYNDFFGKGQKPVSWEDISLKITQNWQWLFAVLLALLACYVTKAIKLAVVCKPLTGKFHFKTCFETAIIGHYYNYVTPLAVGGQPFEIYHLSKHGVGGGAAAALPIATYVLNQFAYVIIGIVFIIMLKFNTLGINLKLLSQFTPAFMAMATIGLILCLVVPTMVIIFSLMPRVGATLVRFVMFIGGKLRIIKNPKLATYKTIKNVISNARCLKNMMKHPVASITCFLVSFMEHFASASISFFTLMMFGFYPNFLSENFFLSWLQIVQLSIMLTYSVSFIPTPGNAGAADLSFGLLFGLGLDTGLTFTATIAWRFFGFYSFIIIGFVFTTIKKRFDVKREKRLHSIN